MSQSNDFRINNTLLSKSQVANIAKIPIFNANRIQSIEASDTSPSDQDLIPPLV